MEDEDDGSKMALVRTTDEGCVPSRWLAFPWCCQVWCKHSSKLPHQKVALKTPLYGIDGATIAQPVGTEEWPHRTPAH